MFRKFIPKKEIPGSSAKQPAPAPDESADTAESEVSETPVFTEIPGRAPIELVRTYRSFANYYPSCELRTKEWFVRNMESDWVTLDCGANVGVYSVLFSQCAPNGKIFAFEPTSTIDLLTANLNHNNASNVEPLQIGVGQRTGRIRERVFRMWGNDPENAFFEFTTVDDFVESRGLERVDCIKIDVDSHDFDVLKGAERTMERLNPWIVVEVNYALRKRGINESEVHRWLSERGYKDALVLDGENLILKRDVNPARSNDRPTLPLTMWLE